VAKDMKIKRLIGGPLESNGYIIYHREKDICYIVDPGYDPERYISVLEQMEMQLMGILLTHHHYDHVGAVEGIVKRFGCPVYLHRDDCGQYGRSVDYMLEGGQSIMLGHEEIKVIHTPGHTKGSVCYYSEKSKAAFTGDSIFNVDLGRTDLSDGSPAQMESSIRNVISKWESDITIYPGHGDPATMEFVRKHNQEYLDIMG
jgi:hydroxyacylglutathione hydrolase